MVEGLRIGVDVGGTKIEGLVLGAGNEQISRMRVASPGGDYGATVEAIADLVERLERESDARGSVGVGIPGSAVPVTGEIQNANSTWLNGKPLAADLSARLSRPVRLANDANCFALSEAVDGAGAAARCVFGVILGTGCGGGLVVDKALINGPLGISGEWGHTPLPSPWPLPSSKSDADEVPGPLCWCGRHGCMEVWVSGPGLQRDHELVTGQTFSPEAIAERAATGDAQAVQTLERHAERLARGLACIINIIDPDVIVLGGGLSNFAHIYDDLPRLIEPHIFSDAPHVDIRRAVHGDSSGVRGAAWLWSVEEAAKL